MAEDYNSWFNQAGSTFDQAKANALPSAESLDTASARIRSRLQGAQDSLESKLGDSYTGNQGWGSGAYSGALSKSRGDYMGNLSKGLADTQQNYWDDQMKGAQTLANIGIGQAGIGTSLGDIGAKEKANLIQSAMNSILSTHYAASDATAAQQVADQAKYQAGQLTSDHINAINQVLGTFGIKGSTLTNNNWLSAAKPLLSQILPDINWDSIGNSAPFMPMVGVANSSATSSG